ncbi:hypothetical protein Hanom_Chr07g00664281 [Helianthus anomalus]
MRINQSISTSINQSIIRICIRSNPIHNHLIHQFPSLNTLPNVTHRQDHDSQRINRYPNSRIHHFFRKTRR